MTEWRVTLEGSGREIYIVTAETEDEARENWHQGWRMIQETYGMTVESVEAEDE